MVTQQLVLGRLDLFSDKCEGRHGRELRAYLKSLTFPLPQELAPDQRDHVAEQNVELMLRMEDDHRAISYVSCWCAGGQIESEAMWRIYAGAGASVALVLPYERLRDSLSGESVFIGNVTYFDYGKSVIPYGNVLLPLMFKRHEFSYEKEVRVIQWQHEYLDHNGQAKPDRPAVLTMPWNLQEHIEKIVISPYTTPWQAQAIRGITARLCPGLESKIIDSEMGGEPH